MYKVTVDGALVGYSDTVVFVRLAKNGCYIPCTELEAAGVCVKLPYKYNNEDGNTVRTVKDFVFKLKGGSLLGFEQEAKLERTNGALLVAQTEDIIDILLEGNEEQAKEYKRQLNKSPTTLIVALTSESRQNDVDSNGVYDRVDSDNRIKKESVKLDNLK